MSKPAAALQRAKVRVSRALAARVRVWAEGVDTVYPDDPRRRLDADPTSSAPVRLLQYGDSDGVAVQVGKYCAIHHKAAIFHGGEHHLDWVGVQNSSWVDGNLVPAEGAPYSRGPVVIGNDVYIGYEALIMSGVRIGDGAVVSARAWVTRDVEPYEIVAGNPARRAGWRFDAELREALLRIRWWDWPVERIREHQHEINSADVAGFVARHDPGPPAA